VITKVKRRGQRNESQAPSNTTYHGEEEQPAKESEKVQHRQEENPECNSPEKCLKEGAEYSVRSRKPQLRN
jgi:hypothetical protein